MLMRRYRSNDKIHLYLFWLSLPNKLHSPETICQSAFRQILICFEPVSSVSITDFIFRRNT